MSGIQTHGMMELSLAQMVDTLDKTMVVLNAANLSNLPLVDIVRLIPVLGKEVRATSSKLHDARVTEESNELVMSGAIAVVEYLYSTFEDNSAILPPLKEACRAALAKLQGD